MKDEHAQFSGRIPAAYHRYLGPMLFRPYAEDLCKENGVASKDHTRSDSCTGLDRWERRGPGSAPEGSRARTPSERVVTACYYCANPSESMLPFTVVA